MTLLIDNYDSFSYNLYQLLGQLDPEIQVIRNDQMTVAEIRALHPRRIVLSPGPGRPEQAGVLLEAVRQLGPEIPLLGVCLVHQAICAAFGGTVDYAPQLCHGKASLALLDPACPLFRGCPPETPVARYHSLAARRETLPDCLAVTAATEDGQVMAVQHTTYPIYGLQFHPESILTPYGSTMLANFLERSSV